MRRIILAVAVVAAIVASYGLGRRHSQSQIGSQAERRVLYYVDPMHPSYKSDKPGIAPDCGMQLEPVYADAAGSGAPSSPVAQLPAGAVGIDGPTQRLLGIRVATVEKSGATRRITAVGRVAVEDTRVYRLNAGVDGFIRETHDDSVGNQVKKDQKLASFYSPEFLSVASGFLAASERLPGSVGQDGNRTIAFPGAVNKQGSSSLQGYSDRLRNLGMNDVQIKQIADARQLPTSVDVFAPADGFILARNISPGQHFDHDMEFYRIADLSKVWVIAEVYAQEAPYLRPGSPAQVTLREQGRQLSARVTDSLPQSEAGGGTVKLRLEVDNPNFLLRPEMLVDVAFPVRLQPAVTVPLDALVDSGARARVYVERGEGVFEPREVETGWRFGERVEIRHGVQPGERVVVAATFLVDSESRLKAPSPA
ncbi:MAG TPA: efflux RND transporter periplasmic adaptor subunit, partial [Bryobacteraceae bacterium]|nr:efflux RND transporter periplasmic adaptor subunit [Bryobacteraceae bacterium]